MPSKDLIVNTQELTMSSLEIAKLVESRHDSVKRTIERLSEIKIKNGEEIPPVIVRPPMVDEQKVVLIEARCRDPNVWQC